jgi:hypothetical protein
MIDYTKEDFTKNAEVRLDIDIVAAAAFRSRLEGTSRY